MLHQRLNLRDILTATGWQTEANNIHRLPGVELDASGPGQLETAYGDHIRLIEDNLVVLRQSIHPNPERPDSVIFEHTEVARFTVLADLLVWLKVHGRVSEPGHSHIPGRFL